MPEVHGPPAEGAVSANGHRPEVAQADEDAQAPAAADSASQLDDDAAAQAEWFLRTGRAGLLPESMTEAWQENGHVTPRRATAGAPPWAGDRPGPAADAPPPWESGPWPGPGEEAGPDEQRDEVRPAAVPASPAAADTGNWQASAAVVAGLVPVVVPGLVLGVLGLRRARVTGTGRTGSWLAIALSAIWAVILVVWLASAGGSAGSACGNYQNVVGYPVSQVLRDLSASAPDSVLGSDLEKAITQANAAAASAQQVTARNAMATLTVSLQHVAGELGSRPDAVMRQQVAAAAAAMTSACRA
jgi:hypothetical protein